MIAATLFLVMLAATSQAAEPVGQLAGRVVDDAGAPVADAQVVLRDHASGVPLVEKTFRTLTDVALTGDLKDPRLVTYKTDREGRFHFDAVPVGKYRLIAQSWPNGDMHNVLSELAAEVRLCGTVDDVTVSAQPSDEVVIRPLGAGVLRIDDNLNKDGALVALSTSPTRADPALGFLGWGGPFARDAIGFSRKKAGPLVVSGLPEGEIHVAVCGFFADDMSGWGAGEVVVTSQEPTDLRVPVLSAWAGHHKPPERLQTLVAEIRFDGARDILSLVLQQTEIAFPPSSGGGLRDVWRRDQVIAQHLDRRVTLPSGREATFGDVMAAMHYLRLEKLREREQN